MAGSNSSTKNKQSNVPKLPVQKRGRDPGCSEPYGCVFCGGGSSGSECIYSIQKDPGRLPEENERDIGW